MVYAMKEIDLQGMSRKVSAASMHGSKLRAEQILHCSQEQEECIRETRVLSSLDSDQIIKYYDSFLERVSSRGAARYL